MKASRTVLREGDTNLPLEEGKAVAPYSTTRRFALKSVVRKH